MRSYCKIFVRSQHQLKDLCQILVAELEPTELVQPSSTYYLDTQELSLAMFNNKEYDPQKIEDPLDGFLFYPIILDVEPASAREIYEMDISEKERYLSSVLHLVQALKKMSLSVVPACDFEDALKA